MSSGGGGGGGGGGGPSGGAGGSNSSSAGSGAVGRGARVRPPTGAAGALPQEAVTPTRRELRANNVDWIPVSEYNSRTHNRSRKPINALPENNEYVEIDSNVIPEISNRFVPVRPQPRTLVLRQRDIMETQDDASYNPILSGHSPHTSHTAIMIVNPTTPNSNFPNQNNLTNGHSNDNRINSKNICTNHEANSSMSNHATLIGPFPVLTNNSNKSSNISGDNHDSIHQNGHMSNEIQHSENGLSHTKIARTIGETLVSACPDTTRVEQRLGQIQEYIRVTASLVDSMRNSEDELRNRLASLRRSNLLLTKGIYQDVNHESNNDLDELLQSLQDLKDSEKKLESMLQTTLQLTEAGKSKENDGKLEELNDAAIEISEITSDDKHSEVLNVVKSDENINQDAPRSYSVQSGGSAYSDNELWQNDLDMKMEVSQLQAAFQEQQKKLLKYQADSREKAEAHSSNNEHFDNALMDNVREQTSNNHQPLLMQNAGRAFSSNQIGVATTLPHIIDDKEYMKNQMQLRRFSSHEREPNEASTSRDMSGNRSKEQSFVSEADMLRDLKMRRQHLENQVAKIQSLHVATTSLVEAVADEQSGIITPDDQSLRGTGLWEESEDSIPEDDSIVALNSLKSKMEAVNVVKVELEKLKSMLRTVDSIQNNFGINSTFDNDDSYDVMIENQDNQNLNHNQLSESSFNNVMRSKVEPTGPGNINRSISQSPKNLNTQGLPRLQNCISTGSGKCTNVNDQQQRRDSISAGLATIQQLTQKMKQEAQEISSERQRIKHAFNRDSSNSRASSIKSDDKRRSNSIEKTSHVYPIESGPLERKQLALKAELEAKKKQLERLMSKEVDHRTNQQIPQCDVESTSKTPSSSNDNGFATQEASPPVLQHSQSSHSNRFDDNDVYPCHIRSEADNGYSSDQDGEDEYGLSSIPQVNINQLNDRCPTKRSSQNSSIESFKINYNDSTQSIDSSNQTVKHNNNHSNTFDMPNAEKQRNKNEGVVKPVLPHCSNSSKVVQDICNEPRNLRESCQRQRSNSREIETNILPKSQPLIALPTSSATPLQTVPNKSVNPTDSIEIISHLDSGSSSGDQELPDIPNPMPELSLRRTVIKNDQENHNPNIDPRNWQNPHSESQVTMWWHNKANQLQQQLEMINNLCQSLLQDRLTNQSPPSTSSSLPHQLGNAAIMPNCPNTFMLPYNFGVAPMSDQMGVPWWGVTQQQLALQQQQLAAQQQQLAANSWSNSQCVQHLLSQQREISSLKNSINILEDKLQMLNMGYPSNNPNLPNLDVGQNSSVSRTQSQAWTNPQMNSFTNLIDPQQLNEFNAPWLQQANRHNLYHNRPQFPSKKTPVIPPYPADHINNHMSVFPTQAMMNDQISNQMGMSVAPNNLSNQPGIVFNNCLPANQINPNLLNNQNMNSNSMLNMPPHSSIHNTHAMAMHTMSGGSTQSLTGQNIALNNQVPPGNRANNYWDNFRSYSRQNLLSGNNKTNAESVAQSHSHHPLPERSHNTLRISSSTVPSQTQAVNTPKRNLNNQLGNSTLNQFHNNPTLQVNCQENVVRGRRNLSNEVTFNTPPDVLNMNSDAVPIANAPLNVEEYNRTNNSVNLNINRSCVLDSDSELVLSNSNNLNTPRASFTHKKKSSSKLPAKNSSNAGNYSLESLQNKNVESDITDHNLISTSSIVKQKSPTKLFDLLRENVYSEVSALISANESRPHFLIQLFRDLQQISSDTLRQRTLQSIQELVTRYLSTVEVESYGSTEDPKNIHRVTSSSEDQLCPTTSNETEIFALDNNNEIIRFIFAHHADPCTSELFQSLRAIIYSIAGNIPKKIDDNLLACFNKYPGCTLMDIGDELIMIISRITSECKKKPEVSIAASSEGFSNDIINDGQIDPVESNNTELNPRLVDIAQASFNEASELPSCSSSSVNKQVDINPDNSACSSSYNASSNELKIDLIESVETCNGDLAEADQSRHGNDSSTANGGFENLLPDIVDMDEQTPTEAEAEWLRMDRMPPHIESDDCIESQNDVNQS